jgi:hypothetical protein
VPDQRLKGALQLPHHATWPPTIFSVARNDPYRQFVALLPLPRAHTQTRAHHQATEDLILAQDRFETMSTSMRQLEADNLKLQVTCPALAVL